MKIMRKTQIAILTAVGSHIQGKEDGRWFTCSTSGASCIMMRFSSLRTNQNALK